jgi:gluconate 2-dehydrogenase gamma chain
MAVAAAVPAVQAQQHQHGQEFVQVPGAYRPKVLTAGEMTWVATLVDIIIPRTDTPGASDAGVPAFIDRRMKASAKLAGEFREGMGLLDAEAKSKFDGRSFPALTADEQIALLTPISADTSTRLGSFFKLAKALTVDGYYTSKAGLTQELGWHGNTYLTEFKGCTHPEHQS